MTDQQLYLAIGVPVVLNIGLITFLYLALSKRIDDLKELMDTRFDAAHQNLFRVEQVLDARLKHLEER